MGKAPEFPEIFGLRQAIRRSANVGIFAIWFAVTSLVGCWLAAAHPARALHGPLLSGDAARAASRAWYVLGSDCGFSDGIAQTLAKSGPREGLQEEVILVADLPAVETGLKSAGFNVRRADLSALHRDGKVQLAPWLALFDSFGRLTYSGPFREPGIGGNPGKDAIFDLIKMKF